MISRKKSLFVFLIFMLSAVASAQGIGTGRTVTDPTRYYTPAVKNRNYSRWTGTRYEIKWKDVLPLNDTTYLLYSEDRLNAYFGRVDNPERHFRNGFGVLRHTGTYDVEYYVGTWKRDMKHGQGISRIEGDSVFVATWKFGILQKDSVRKPTEAELEELATWEGRACQWLSLVR